MINELAEGKSGITLLNTKFVILLYACEPNPSDRYISPPLAFERPTLWRVTCLCISSSKRNVHLIHSWLIENPKFVSIDNVYISWSTTATNWCYLLLMTYKSPVVKNISIFHWKRIKKSDISRLMLFIFQIVKGSSQFFTVIIKCVELMKRRTKNEPRLQLCLALSR